MIIMFELNWLESYVYMYMDVCMNAAVTIAFYQVRDVRTLSEQNIDDS